MAMSIGDVGNKKKDDFAINSRKRASWYRREINKTEIEMWQFTFISSCAREREQRCISSNQDILMCAEADLPWGMYKSVPP